MVVGLGVVATVDGAVVMAGLLRMLELVGMLLAVLLLLLFVLVLLMMMILMLLAVLMQTKARALGGVAPNTGGAGHPPRGDLAQADGGQPGGGRGHGVQVAAAQAPLAGAVVAPVAAVVGGGGGGGGNGCVVGGSRAGVGRGRVSGLRLRWRRLL